MVKQDSISLYELLTKHLGVKEMPKMGMGNKGTKKNSGNMKKGSKKTMGKMKMKMPKAPKGGMGY